MNRTSYIFALSSHANRFVLFCFFISPKILTGHYKKEANYVSAGTPHTYKNKNNNKKTQNKIKQNNILHWHTDVEIVGIDENVH